ncbi:MAG: class A beta-lactamase [Gemmatimonadales bacterium]
MHSRFTIVLWSAGAALALALPVSAQEPGLARLERELARLADGVVCKDARCKGTGMVGVGVIHLESGREVYLNADKQFPMASTYKVPIAVQLLTRVDRGEIRLDSLVEVETGDLHPGSGTLTPLFDDPGVILSVRNLLELMLLISDNSATDILMRLAGGSGAVTERMTALGLTGISVNRPTISLIADWVGIVELPPEAEWTPERFGELARTVTPEMRDSAAAAFDRDPRDTATPRGMAQLLARLWRGELLSDSSTALLLDIMTRCRTGENRLKGLLAPGTDVAHKTGTIGATTNDVGIITLPDDAGHVVVAAFVKESERQVPDRERVIAHAARAAHDYFLFNPEGR